MTWSTANNLPSDSISDIVDNDGILFVATPDEGLARKDIASGNWLAVWHEGNWLSSNDVRDLSVHGAAVSILTDSALQVYDTSQGGFTGTATLDDMGLSQTGMDLVIWPAGASRSPLVTALLVSDGSGRLAVLDAAAAPQALGDLLLATTPTNTEVHDVLELDGILYAAGDRGIDRFDIRARAWMTSLDPEYGVIGMATDGSRLFSVGDELSIDVWARNGTLLQSITMGMSAEPTALAWDPLTGSLLITLGEDGLARLEMSSGSIDIWNDNDDFQQGHAFDVVARNGVAFVAIEGEGIARVDLVNEEILGSWRSSGVDDAAQAPIAVSGDRVYLGLYDAGVFIFDRDSGELVETWAQEDEEWWWLEDDWDATQFATLPNTWITALHVDMDGDVYVGHETGFSRRSDDGFDSPGNGEQWLFGGKTTGFASEGSTLYALQEWQGVCLYRRSDLHQRECWNDRPNSDVRIDTTGGQSLTIPSPNRLYVSTDHGAYLIDTLNETLLQEWSTGGSSWNTPVVVYDDVAHLAVDGVGVVRYDLDTQRWLSTWNAASGILPEDGVTALSDDVTTSHLWVGGDFGLIEIDMSTGTQIRHWDHEHNPSVSRLAPQQLVRIDEVLHYLETPPERRDFPIDIDDINDAPGDNGNSNGRQRPGQNQPSTRVFRYDVDSGQKLSTLNPTARFNRELSIIGMENVRSDELWIGVGKPYGYFWSDEPGGIARWDSGSSNWLGDIEPDTVNNNDGIAALIGACDVASIQADADGCHILSSYGDSNHRLLAMDSTVEFELGASDLDETVRAVVTWDGHGLLATADGVVRIDASDWTMADTWTAGNGLPPSASDNVRSLEIVNDDLWMITKSSSSSSRAQIHRLDGSTGAWMTWSGSSTEEIPAGTGVSIQKCSEIVYFAFEGEVWDGEGGIARYDTINDDWLDPFEAEWRDWGPDPDEEGLMWSSVTSLACDDENILYAGLDEGDYGIQRYDTEEDEWLESLDPWDHDFSPSGITNDAMAWADGTLAFGHEQGGNFGFDEGALSLVAVRGDWVGGGRSVDEGITTSSVVAYPQLPGMGADWLVAQPGASGPGRAKLFDSMGGEVGILDAWTGLVDGRARHFAGNTTHVYAALLASDMDR
ncbi:MAG TPA: hypothetical protein EYQ80_03405, partial [Candidatus Poseidoniales archaeon]|nr:hypothetical protein [Candidatus Poseidoniales archaeon]